MEDHNDEGSAASPTNISRRKFLKGSVATTAAVSVGTFVSERAAARTHGLKVEGPGKVPVRLSVNGVEHRISAEPRLTLADAIRDELGLTGTKIICDRGECGGCTVLMDGMPVYSCMMLAIESQDRQILTVEGLYKGDQLHPVQQAFIEKDALMCGFCTPGFIMSVKALLDQNPNPTLEEVKRSVSGNLCRCGTYPKVFEAALTASDNMKKGG